MKNKVLASLVIILLPLMTVATTPTYAGEHNNTTYLIPLETKVNRNVVSVEDVSQEDVRLKIASSRPYSEVYINDSLIIGNVLIANDSYVVFENVTLGNETYELTIDLYNSSTLIIRNSTLINIEVNAYDSATLIIQDSIVKGEGSHDISLHSTSILTIENVSTYNTILGIDSRDSSYVSIHKFKGDLDMTTNGFVNVELNNININSTGYFFASYGVNLYVNELFNLTTETYISFDIYNSTVIITNATFINSISMGSNSIVNISYANVSYISVGDSVWKYPEKSYAILVNTTVHDLMNIYSIGITRIYNSTISSCIIAKVYNNTNVLILPGEVYGDSYLPIVLDENSIIYNQNTVSDSFIILDSSFLINNSASLSTLWVVNSTGLLNDSSIIQNLYLFYSKMRIGNGSYAIYINMFDNSGLQILDVNTWFHLYSYRNSTTLIDNLTISDFADIYWHVENSILMLNNSELAFLGDFYLDVIDSSIVEINNSLINNVAYWESHISVTNSDLKIVNSSISKNSMMHIQAVFSHITILNSSIITPTGYEFKIDILDSMLFINDSLVNATIYGDMPYGFYYGPEPSNITYHGAYIEMYNVSNVSLILEQGYARVENSTLYDIEAYGRVELYNCWILSSVLFNIEVNDGELYISHGFYDGSGIESSLYLDPGCNIPASTMVIINGLIAYNSIVYVSDVNVTINLNITDSELSIRNGGIGYLLNTEYYEEGHALFSNSTIKLENVLVDNIENVYAYRSELFFNNSDIKGSIYTYLSNVSVYSSYVEEIITGLLATEYFVIMPFNDTGNIYVEDSTVDTLVPITYGDHIIDSSSIGFLGCVLSNVTIGNDSSIGTLMETYHWINDGYVLNNITHGFYLNVTIKPDNTVTFINKTLGVMVKGGYVWVNNSFLFAAVAMENGHLYVNSSIVLNQIIAMDSGIVELSNVTMDQEIGQILVRGAGYVEVDNVSTPFILLMDKGGAKISNSLIYTIDLTGENNLEGHNIDVSGSIHSLNGSIKLYDSEIQYLCTVNSDIEFVNISSYQVTLYNTTAIVNDSYIEYFSTYDSVVEIYRTHFVWEVWLHSGDVKLINTTTSLWASITLLNCHLLARNINTTRIGITGLYVHYGLFNGYDGTNDYAYLYLVNSNVTELYGMHFIVKRGGYVTFDNGTIVDEKNSVTELSNYVNCNLGMEVATFYITDFALVKINGYKESNNRLISSLIVMQFTDDIAPVIERLHEENITVEYGVTEIPLAWDVIDEYPWYYELYFNETLVSTGSIEIIHTVEINASDIIEGPGLYLITLIAYDYAGNVGESDVTRLTVLTSKAPEITVNVESIEFEIGMSPSNVTWTLHDDTPTFYELYLNDTLIETDNYTSGDKVVFFTKNEITEAGTYILELIAFDGVGNNSSLTVVITAYPEEAPEISLYPEDEYNITIGDYILLNWTASDRFPSTYQILINDTVVKSGTWTSGDLITYNFTETEVGTYIVKIIFNDEAGHSSIHSVTINVVPEKAPPPGPGPRPLGITEIVIIVVVTVASVIVIFLVIIPHIRRK